MMATPIQMLAIQLKAAAETFLAQKPIGKSQKPATEQQFCGYVITMAKKMAKRFKGQDNYDPIEPGEDPEAYRRLDALGHGEVPDEDLESMAEGEAPEDMDFMGGLF